MRLTHQLTCRCVPSQALASSGLPRSSSWRPFSSHINHQLADHQHVCVGHRCRGHRCRVLSSRASCPLRLVLCIDFVLHVRIDFESAKRAGRRSASVGGARVCGRRPSVHVHGACVRSVTGSCLDPMPKPQWTRCTLWPELRACCYVLGARGCVHARMCAREDVRARRRTHAHEEMLLCAGRWGAGPAGLCD